MKTNLHSFFINNSPYNTISLANNKIIAIHIT